ncbi:MAG: type 1 glutamine amidotransferase [Planctomycetota bacterium]
MKTLIIQHDAADPPALAGDVVNQLGHTVQILRLDRGDEIPTETDAQLLMTFGGGFSLALEKPPPWVERECRLVRWMAEQQRRVLGICLGSQLVAKALGATVTRNAEPEVGWHPVRRTESAKGRIAECFPAGDLTVFHWHRDTFGIPPAADHILRSNGCHHQGFVIDDRIVGLQFHLEASAKTVTTFMAVSQLWRKQAAHVQPREEIERGIETYLPRQREVLTDLLSTLTLS